MDNDLSLSVYKGLHDFGSVFLWVPPCMMSAFDMVGLGQLDRQQYKMKEYRVISRIVKGEEFADIHCPPFPRLRR